MDDELNRITLLRKRTSLISITNLFLYTQKDKGDCILQLRCIQKGIYPI